MFLAKILLANMLTAQMFMGKPPRTLPPTPEAPSMGPPNHLPQILIFIIITPCVSLNWSLVLPTLLQEEISRNLFQPISPLLSLYFTQSVKECFLLVQLPSLDFADYILLVQFSMFLCFLYFLQICSCIQRLG